MPNSQSYRHSENMFIAVIVVAIMVIDCGRRGLWPSLSNPHTADATQLDGRVASACVLDFTLLFLTQPSLHLIHIINQLTAL